MSPVLVLVESDIEAEEKQCLYEVASYSSSVVVEIRSSASALDRRNDCLIVFLDCPYSLWYLFHDQLLKLMRMFNHTRLFS